MAKTIKVEKILDKVNAALALEPNHILTDDWRRGAMYVLETILHDTDTYAGFGYIETYDGQKFEKGVTNESRVFYIKSRKL